MIVNEFSKTTDRCTDIFCNIICDKCNKPHTRQRKHYRKMSSYAKWDMDYCNTCWRGINATEEYRRKMSESVKKALAHPDVRTKLSAASKGKKLGDDNPMRRPEVRSKVSETRKKLFSDPATGAIIRDKISTACKKAWEDGRYIGSNTSGESTWYSYTHSNGTVYKVQGRYELRFIEWLDEKNMTFTCHTGRLPYEVNGETHNYYPDFYVDEWQCYVDVKSAYWLSKQRDKFDALEIKYPGQIKIFLEEDFKNTE